MSLDEVREVGKHAFWTGQKEEFFWVPPGDVVYWRPFDDDGRVLRHSWQSRPADREVPASGWYHVSPCACDFCAAIGY